MSSNDLEVAKKVLNDVFDNNVLPNTKSDLDQRLFVAHTIVNQMLLGGVDQMGGVVEGWQSELEDIEEQINKLRNALVSA